MSEEGMTPGPEHGPSPAIWPLGFAVGIAVALVGLIVNPEWVATIGAAIAIVFGFLWARGATSEMRRSVPTVTAEVREATPAEVAAAPPATVGEAAMPPPEPGEKFPRSRFLEGATLGLGAVIGGIVTVPVAGFALLPSFLGQKGHKVDLGPVDAYPVGKWFIATFMVDPSEGEVSRRTAFVRNNGPVPPKNAPSFTIISNRCAHLGCPVQANGPSGVILGEKNVTEHTTNGSILLRPVVPAGFGCPCHGGQYDTEGNRTAGPPVRALDRYGFDIVNGHLVLLSTFSVSHVVGSGGQAKIYKYKLAGPGEHVDGPEQWFYPLNPPHH
ncbi:MAG: Rieske 2Fe-2S domain-containing protein [Actinobacteria bacterium]|nr:MAG: Rieske 2Fe-2S domain-containing protein [Actinomycetota bacterium]